MDGGGRGPGRGGNKNRRRGPGRGNNNFRESDTSAENRDGGNSKSGGSYGNRDNWRRPQQQETDGGRQQQNSNTSRNHSRNRNQNRRGDDRQENRNRGYGNNGNEEEHRNRGQSSRGNNDNEEEYRNRDQSSRGNNDDEQPPQKRRFNPFSWHNMNQFASDTYNDNDVVTTFANSEYDLDTFLKDLIRLDVFILFMKILKKICGSDYDEGIVKILRQICVNRMFLDSISSKIYEATDSKLPNTCNEMVSNILCLFKTIAKVMPDLAADKLKYTLKACYISCDALVKEEKLNEDLLQGFIDIATKFETREKEKKERAEKKKSNKFLHLHNQDPPDNFRELSVFPTSEDVLCENNEIFLRPNLINGPYKDIEHYLDVHFRLLKEDFMRPLREGIKAYLSGDKELIRSSSIRVFEKVLFLTNEDKLVKQVLAKSEKNRNNPEGIVVNFNPDKKLKKVEWEYSRRFMYGALLCFSKDKFKTILIATISDRDVRSLENGILRVTFCHEVNENIYKCNYTMLEADVFFDPYLHALKTLQIYDNDTFPLPEHIVSLQNAKFPPAYLDPLDGQREKQYMVKLKDYTQAPFIVTRLHTWPTNDELGLDSSQYTALISALTQELVVIQGPPGTGKTFMGLKIAEILIENRVNTHRKTPILVICLTNHALDQFLVGILNITKNVVRIGGQSKCAELDEYNLRVIKRQQKSRDFMKLMGNLRAQIRGINKQLQNLNYSIGLLTNGKGVVSFNTLIELNVIPNEVRRALSNENFLKWLISDHFEASFEIEEIEGGIDFCLTLKQLDDKILELEHLKKIPAHNLHAIQSEQKDFENFKKWIEDQLNEDTASSEQATSWINAIWELSNYQRWQLYKYWIKQVENIYLEKIQEEENNLRIKNDEVSGLQILEDLEILRGCDIVGMTTNGAARLHNLMRKLGCEIVIVEEAAEVLESHVIACLTNKCLQLILIGDHKQLQPSIECYELETKYNFNVSLFERLVLNNYSCVTLEKQHRMSPDISKLITPTIYEKLINAPIVFNYPNIRGIPERLFFINHTNYEETTDKDNNSKINRFEASFIIHLCRYLVFQGYDPSKITILTTYRGQMFHIKKEIKNEQFKERLQGVIIQVVDNYQGEENDIILLSLVRSNENHNTGFLKKENRVCVALSRAKHALYMIGNMKCLTNDPKISQDKNVWVKINKTLIQGGNIDTALKLRCTVHPNKEFTVSSDQEFMLKSPQGGCNEICGADLSFCQHKCKQLCHTLNRDHSTVQCEETCGRLCKNELHQCKKKCYKNCGDCKVKVIKTLHCGHEIKTECYRDIKTIKCKEKVMKTFIPCQHTCEAECYVDVIKDQCPIPCDYKLDCGHSCTLKCHVTRDPGHLQYSCEKPCAKFNLFCSTEKHKCKKRCSEICNECDVEVNKLRSCGHQVKILCSVNPEAIARCNAKCTKTLSCGHACKLKCYETCKCKQIVSKIAPCGHTVQIECCKTASLNDCNGKCKKLLYCEHPCDRKCNESCTAQCKVSVNQVVGICGHQVSLRCWEKRQGIYKPDSSRCNEKCSTKLNCGHLCSGTCGSCFQSRFHKLCDQPCGRSLVCGHSCKQPCAALCPPCEEMCPYKCIHSKCYKKCGVPCVPCKEKCTWSCVHKKCTRYCGDECNRTACDYPCPKRLKCNHECIGFCGEPCPSKCRICNKDEVTDIFFGNEAEPDAKFVYLANCNHIIESKAMKQWLAENQSSIGKKTCPRCKSEIIDHPRFGNEIKKSFKDIHKVKEKTFGKPKENDDKRRNLKATVHKLIDKFEPSVFQRFTSLLTNSNYADISYPKLYEYLKITEQSLDLTIDGKQNLLSETELNCKRIEVDILTKLCEIWHKTDTKEINSRKFLKPYIDTILENLEQKKRRLTDQPVDDFNLEIRRIQRYAQYLLLKSKANIYDVKRHCDQFEAVVLNCSKRYSEESDKTGEVLLEQIKTILTSYVPGLGITEFERKEIVKAIGLNPGHWFKCPNGHPYVIGECGGAMQLSRCPECNVPIGGANHALTTGNVHAGEMDGSRFASWSDQANNFNNYQF